MCLLTATLWHIAMPGAEAVHHFRSMGSLCNDTFAMGSVATAGDLVDKGAVRTGIVEYACCRTRTLAGHPTSSDQGLARLKSGRSCRCRQDSREEDRPLAVGEGPSRLGWSRPWLALWDELGDAILAGVAVVIVMLLMFLLPRQQIVAAVQDMREGLV